jgi:hypothetical protein
VPSPASFGIEHFGERTIKIALAYTFERHVTQDGAAPLSTISRWPVPTIYAMAPNAALLPVPGTYVFRYIRPFPSAKVEKPKLATKKPPTKATTSPRDPATTGAVETSTSPAVAPPRPPRPVGPQLSVARPPANVWAQPR